MTEAAGDWNNTAIVPELVPPVGAGGFDRFSDPGIGIILGGEQKLNAGTTLDSWLADSVAASKALFAGCNYRGAKPVKIGTEVGRLVSVDCGSTAASPILQIAVATDKGAGYEFVWRGRGGSVAEDLATFVAILATVRYG